MVFIIMTRLFRGALLSSTLDRQYHNTTPTFTSNTSSFAPLNQFPLSLPNKKRRQKNCVCFVKKERISLESAKCGMSNWLTLYQLDRQTFFLISSLYLDKGNQHQHTPHHINTFKSVVRSRRMKQRRFFVWWSSKIFLLLEIEKKNKEE